MVHATRIERRGIEGTFGRAFQVGSGPNHLLRVALAAFALGMTGVALFELVDKFRFPGVDLEIPLRAAERWAHGDAPYLAGSFNAPAGPDLPYLYPPALLPVLTPLLALPRAPLLLAWCATCLAAAVWSCRRLRSPWWLIPALVVWPPFAEGILGGNVQVLLFALYVALFFRGGPGRSDLRPRPRRVPRNHAEESGEGALAALIAAFKVAQLHPWAYLLFRRPRSAVIGACLIGGGVALTVPITGVAIWFEWFDQARRAADPTWTLAGIALGRYLTQPVGLVFTAASIIALRWVPQARAGWWVGLLSVVGAPSLHTFGLLFMLPATLAIRRELALLAAFFVSTYTEPGFWIAITIVAAAFFLGELRAPALLEKDTSNDNRASLPATTA